LKTESNDRRRAWVEVDLSAIRRNAQRLAALLPGSRLLPMIKADGYGLGAVRVAQALSSADVWGLGVATAEEGAILRSADYSGRVVVFSPLPSRDAADIVRVGLEPAVTSFEALEVFGRVAADAGVRLPVHLEVDTGMGRLGVPAAGARFLVSDLARLLADYPLTLASTFTHFHSADSDDAATRVQWAEFQRALECLRAAGIEPGLVHAANSAAALRYKEVAADMIRPGIALFGGGDTPGEPVVSVFARVLDVREVGPGQTVSYGATYRTTERSLLATLAIGYADGVRLELSNQGHVLLSGARAPVRGAVCMDVMVVDVTAIPDVRPGDVATVLGSDGAEQITLRELTEQCGTIEYEILTGLSPRLPRISVESG
jgi:alanine racemase